MSNHYKIPSECYVYDKASDFGKVVSTYFLYNNDIESKSPTDLATDLLRRQNNTRDFNHEIYFGRIVRVLGN